MLRNRRFESIVRPYMPELYRYCVRLSGSVWDGEDLYQEALLKSLRYYARSGHIQYVRPFLFRVAKNLWIDRCRKKRRQTEDELPSDMSATDSSYAEIRGWMEWLHHHLPHRQLVVWLLAEYFRYTMQEIAHELRMTMSAVRSLLHRARERLRQCAAVRVEVAAPGGKMNKHAASAVQIELGVASIMRDNPADLFRVAAVGI